MSFHKGGMKAVVRASGGQKLERQSKRKVGPSPLRLVCLFIPGARKAPGLQGKTQPIITGDRAGELEATEDWVLCGDKLHARARLRVHNGG